MSGTELELVLMENENEKILFARQKAICPSESDVPVRKRLSFLLFIQRTYAESLRGDYEADTMEVWDGKILKMQD